MKVYFKKIFSRNFRRTRFLKKYFLRFTKARRFKKNVFQGKGIFLNYISGTIKECVFFFNSRQSKAV